MSNLELYKPLLELADAIKGREGKIAENPGYFKKSKLKKQKVKLEEKLAESISDLINNSVESWESDQPLDLYLSDELEQIKEVADESWHPAIDDVKGRLLKVASSEIKKSPLRRKIEKNGWWITIAVVAFVMVFLKWYWLVEVTQPIETVEGVRQRTAALEKVLAYDDSMDMRVRRGGWLKGILFWPAEPTDEEIGYAGEILWWTIDIYDYMKKGDLICKANLTYNPDDDKIQDEIQIVKVLVEFIDVSPSTTDDGVEFVAEAFVSKFPCK